MHETPIFPDDEQLAILRGKRDFYYCCCSAARKAADETGIEFVLSRLRAKGIAPAPEEEIVNLVHRYRQAKDNFSLSEELEYEEFTLDHAIAKREASLTHEVNYGPLIQVSPVNPAGVTPSGMLRMLYPDGQRILLLPSHKSKTPSIWHAGLADEDAADAPWYWPLPVTYPPDAAAGTLIKSPEAVTSWNSATTVLDPNQVLALTPAIVAGEVHVRSIVSTFEHRASVTFAVDALNKPDWNSRCRDLRKRLADVGVRVSSFRYDWVAHMPGAVLDNKLVYLAP